MKWLALAGCIVGLLLSGAGRASAETVPLGFEQDTSQWPLAFVAPESLERAESFTVTVTADPVQPLQFQDYVSCTRESETISLQGPETTITPPFTTTILPTLTEPERCWMGATAQASFEAGLPGTVKIEVTGDRRPAPTVPSPAPSPTPAATPSTPTWQTCARPSFLRTGHTEVRGNTCAKARLVVTVAWRKPAKAGASVRALRFSCRRTRHGHSAKVRCTKGTTIIEAKGRLRSRGTA